ncbi:hypothetical protein K7957_08140 [Sphingomonas yunnanensis]|uniref:hypothetical protein n=1 Tax=Sphingomonas yunnanensis TaxID=310400 RepID=UPI001CA7748A|nr:hypothetical protein [Sphingomonas yunnanensis]MBY9062898.1 hypothetical protein [Sphingomonas yunnanensis]
MRTYHLLIAATSTAVLALAAWLGAGSSRGPRAETTPIRVVQGTGSSVPLPVAAAPAPAPSSAPVAPPSAAATGDALLADLLAEDEVLPPAASTGTFHRRLAAEPRDAPWATENERAIIAATRAIPYLDPQVPAQVRCGATLCELVAAVAPEASASNRRIAEEALQRADLLDPAHRSALAVAQTQVASATPHHPDGGVLVRYFTRVR